MLLGGNRREQNFLAVRSDVPVEAVRTAGARGRGVLNRPGEGRDRNAGCERRRIAHVRHHDGTSFGCQKKQLLAVTSPPRHDAAAARDRRFLAVCRKWERTDVNLREAGFIRRVGDPVAIGRELPVRLVELGVKVHRGLTVAG